mmetsp:Transcript_82760/g.181876  ORF Transcript_82760/g.181876 Transcript_82760/m.181876 type:complete len:408 (+) Transcript_82760:94-1317(+)
MEQQSQQQQQQQQQQQPSVSRRPPSLGALSARSGRSGLGAAAATAPRVPPLAANGGLQQVLESANQTSLRGGKSEGDNGQSSGGSLLSAGNSRPPETARTPRDNMRVLSRMERQAQQRAQVYAARHQALLKEREAMHQRIQERRARMAQVREDRFQALLSELTEGAKVEVEATETIRKHEEFLHGKQKELYETWNSEVGQRVEHHLVKWISREKPSLPSGFREFLHRHDDPIKREVHDQDKEHGFHKAAELVLNCSTTTPEELRKRELLTQAMSARETCRPMLPVPNWEQQQHFASPLGYFVQACNRQSEGGDFPSQRRMGRDVHQHDECDGIAAAGKKKERHERNMLGMLEGSLAKEGQSARFKTDHGGGSGAPLQDHYHFQTGIQRELTEVEFPLGKKRFPEIPK